MFIDLVNTLDEEQRAKLYQRGVSRMLLHAWRHGQRLPTEVQVADLADVTGAEWDELQKEITILRAPEARRQQIARALRYKPETSSKV